MLNNKIIASIQSSIDVKQKLISNSELIETISKVATALVSVYKNDGKILFCGNGGSASDAQHLAAELSGRFYYDRPPLYAEALHVNSSFLTAVANDYSYNEVYARMVKAAGRKGDALIAFSTSGNSENIINAIIEAKKIGMTVVGFTGENGGKIKNLVDYLINIPSKDTPRIQESHIVVGHILCEIIESQIFPKR